MSLLDQSSESSASIRKVELHGISEPASFAAAKHSPSMNSAVAEHGSENTIENGRQTDRPVTLKDERDNMCEVRPHNLVGDTEDDEVGVENDIGAFSLSWGTSSNGVGQASSDEENKAPARDEGSRNDEYMDPTPKTPRQEVSPTRGAPGAATGLQSEEESTSELQSIMDQFGGENAYDEEADTRSSVHASPHPNMPSEHPQRRSSLEPLIPTQKQPVHESVNKHQTVTHATKPSGLEHETSPIGTASKTLPVRTSSLPHSAQTKNSSVNASSSPHSSRPLPKNAPPDPDPEPDLPFDFHRFLEQLRHRTADPVAKFLRSFLTEFGKKQWMVHEQEKIIQDFLTFISSKMAQCEIWRGVSDAEFDNAREGMEKLVMNRLYSQTFSPAIPAPAPVSGVKGKRKHAEKLLVPGRKGQHQEDIERDEILGQKVRIYGWVQEEHLDIPPVDSNGRRFLVLAQQELLKIKTYRAPRDKVICVLNCCKVIFGLLRSSEAGDTSADSFVPLLIYVVLHSNPEHLVSNVQYILRFRNQDKLGGEAGYYLSSLMGAIQFIENLDRTSLTISDEDFEKKVEEAVSVFAERHKDEMPPPQPPRHANHPHVSEKSTLSQPEVVPRNSLEVEYSTPRRPTSSKGNGLVLGNDRSDESTAVNGLLRTIQRPLSSLGRMFSEDIPSLQQRSQPEPDLHPEPHPRLSPAVFQPPRNSDEVGRSAENTRSAHMARQYHERKLYAEDAASRQASAEAAEAQKIQRAEHRDVVDTLAGMFPDLDKDLIDDVVRQKQGRVGLAVDACLALNS